MVTQSVGDRLSTSMQLQFEAVSLRCVGDRIVPAAFPLCASRLSSRQWPSAGEGCSSNWNEI